MVVKSFKRLVVGAAVVALVLSVGFISGCGSPSPSSVVKNFHEALVQGDMETVGKLSTPETLAAVAAFSGKITPHVKGLGKITGMEETITGNTAKVEVTYSNGGSDSYDLVKADGKWKVNMDMNSGSGK